MKRSWSYKYLVLIVSIFVCAGILMSQNINNSPKGLNNTSANMKKGEIPILEAIPPTPTGQISFQGKLMDSGIPVNATQNITFRLYTEESGVLPAFWTEIQSVSITNGLFSVMLGSGIPLNTSAVYFSNQVWLGVQPDGAPAELTPRYLLGAVGYAMNLMPGATLVDNNSSGPYLCSFWVSGNEHSAIYGESNTNDAITGVSNADSKSAIIGTANGATAAKGVMGEITSASDDNSAGVWGEKASGAGNAIIGNKGGDMGRAIYGINAGSTGSGVVGKSTNYIGLWGETDDGSHNYGIYTPDNIYSLNYHKPGAIMQIVQNSGNEPLEKGDVVVFSGIRTSLEKEGTPIVQVAKAKSANSTAVAGVVYSRYNFGGISGSDGKGLKGNQEITPEGPVPSGEYLLLVVQGPCQVKTSALAGTIKPGDLLSTSREVGCAEKSNEVSISGIKTAVPGCVLGKALEPIDAGQKTIYVFVTLQ